jgi:2,3-bisphosphoglycerate-dependent phosphoglycerate mutase
MSTQIVFEKHSTTDDSENGIATGWHPGRLSALGHSQARALGDRHRTDGIDAVFTSDLQRAVETATDAFADTALPVLLDWRLRECDYGELNSAHRERVHGRRAEYLDQSYPGGESWTQAVQRVGRFLDDLPLRWDGCRVIVIGHIATHWGFEHFLNGIPLADLIAGESGWQEGWEYTT